MQKPPAGGWSLDEIEAIEDESQRRERYRQEAEKLWSEMPEVTDEERPHVIFFGLLEDTRTKMVVTRRTGAQATFRLLHTNLARLQRATSRVVGELVTTHKGEAQLSVAEQEVIIYERGHEEILIEGRVIPNALHEAILADKRDLVLAIASGTLVAALLISLLLIDLQANPHVATSLDRLFSTFVGTFIVSILGIVHTYWDIKDKKVIAWTVASDQRQKGSQSRQ
jgi:hypothetical protein